MERKAFASFDDQEEKAEVKRRWRPALRFSEYYSTLDGQGALW